MTLKHKCSVNSFCSSYATSLISIMMGFLFIFLSKQAVCQQTKSSFQTCFIAAPLCVSDNWLSGSETSVTLIVKMHIGVPAEVN